jgi:FkbM family methyltransferase
MDCPDGGVVSDIKKSAKRVLKRFLSRDILNKQKRFIWARKARAVGINLRASDLYFDLEKADRVLRIRASHAIYLPHMIENFDYYMDSVVPIRDGTKQIVDMSGPRYHRLVGFGDVPFLFPSHTEPYHTTAEYLDFAHLREGNIVLDIGAYSGVTSIIFAQLVGPSGHVYAFEADKTNYDCAKINIEMAERVMGLRNITLLHKAVWSHSDGVLFSHEGAMGSSAVSITGGGRGIENIVPSTSLADFLRETKLNHVDFIKVDIEGGEIEMLQHSKDILKSINARLIVEPHRVNGSMSTEPCRQILESVGFSVHVGDKTAGSEPLIEAVPICTPGVTRIERYFGKTAVPAKSGSGTTGAPVSLTNSSTAVFTPLYRRLL